MDSQDSVLVSKVPMLKPNEFEMWKIRIKQYMLLTDYALWEVVEHGPSVPEPAVAGAPPNSDADKKRKQTEMKALSTLLLAIPNEYQHQFCTCPDAKSLWNALEKRFSGTKSSKRNQKAMLKQQYENFTSTKNESMTQTFDRFNKLIGELANVDVKMEKDEVNRKFLRSLSEEWTMYTVSFRRGDDLEDKELEDLYNDLRIFEAEVEAKRRPTGYSHTIALYSSENPSSNINTASTANINPASNNHDNTNDKPSLSQDTNGDAVLEAFLANHVRSPLINDDLEQINADDLEEMDIKWQMVMLTMRMKRFIRRTGRNNFDAKRGDLAGFDKSKVRCYKCNEPGHFARECKGSGTHQQANNGGQAYAPRPNRGTNSNSSQALVSQEGMGFDWSDQAEEAIQNHALMAKITEPELPAEVSSKLCSDSCIETVKKYRDHNQTMSDTIKTMEVDRREYRIVIENLEDQIKSYKENELQFEYDYNYWKWQKKEFEKKLVKSGEELESVKKELEKAKEDLDKFSKSSKALEEILKAQVHDELKRGIGYHNTPPPRNHTYIPPTTDILDRLNREELKEGVCDVDPSSSDDEEEQKGKTENKSQETVPEENQILTNEKGGMPFVPSKNATASRKGKEKIVDQEPATSQPLKGGKPTHKNDSDPGASKQSQTSNKPRGNKRNWNNQWAQTHGVDLNKINKPKPCFICCKLNHLAKDCYYNPFNQRMTFQNQRVNFQNQKQFQTRGTEYNSRRSVPKPIVKRQLVQKSKNQPKKKVSVQKKKVEKKTVKIVTKWVPKASLSNTTASTSSGNESVASESSGNNQKGIEVNTAASNSSSGISNTVATTSSSLRQPIVTKYSGHEIPNKDYLLKLNRLTEGNPDRNENLWHVDSGCSRHMTGNRSFLEDFTTFNGGYVTFGDNPRGGKVSGKGKVTGGKLTLEDVYYVDQLRYNLMSVSQVCDKKLFTLFSETECVILSPKFVVDESFVLLRTPRKDNVYCLDLNGMPSKVVNCLFSKASMTESSLWHRRMGHMNIKTMNLLVKNQLVRGLPSKEFTLDDHCVACLKGKKSYCLVIIDDFSRFTWVFFLRTKDETSGLIKPFVKRVENQVNLRVKVIRSDNGTEFKNADLNSFCEEEGIERQFSAPRTPQQNGVAERRNRTLIEAARTMLADSKLPITFWAEAVNTACYVQNRVHVVKSKGKTPYELFKNKKPFIGFFVPFGCPCSILNTKTHLGKFDSKSDDGFFVGYSIQSKAVRVFNTVSRTIEESDNVKFNEHTPNVHGTGPDWLFDIDSLTDSLKMSNAVDTGPIIKEKETDTPFVLFPPSTISSEEKESETEVPEDASEHQEGDKETEETPQLESNEPGDSSEITQPDLSESDPDDSNLGESISEEPLHLTRTQKNHPASQVIGDVASPMITRKQSREAGYVNTHSGMLSCFLSQNEPKKVLDAMKDPSWIEAMQEELLQFVLQHVWDLVDLPKGHRVIGTKWIFRNKTDERGIVIKNKARLVAQGYTQEEGIDYDDVFASVARIEAIRLFLAFASYKGLKVYQMDVKSAFLYGTIDEEVYVCQPPGFEDPKYPDRVCKLRKALYGLHQAPRAWYDTLSSYLLENKFERGVINKTLFIKRTKTDMLLVQIYVDDIIFGSTKEDMCKEFEELMHKKFKMSSMGELTFFLGLQVKQKRDGIFINQSKYVATMLQKFGMNDAKPASTPMETHKHLTTDVEGRKFQVRSKESHLHAVKRIFKYLKGQPKLGLWYPYDNSFDLVAYTDSDYGGANLDRKSTSGGCQFLGGRLVSWQCKKQTTVSQSTTEAEYIAASQCCSQVLWIQNQMQDYGLSFLQTPIYIDDNSAISIVNNPVKHSKTKHIEIKYHLIRDCNEKKLIQVLKVHTDDQYADLFTKAFDVFLHRLQMESLIFVKDHNKIGYLSKGGDSEGFEDIVDFLASSYIAHAATINPTVYIQHMQDFWMNAVVQEEDGVKSIQTTICGLSLTLTPAKIRHHLQLNDEGARLDTLEELATAQHDMLKLHEAQLVKQAKVIQAQGASIASMKDVEMETEAKGEEHKETGIGAETSLEVNEETQIADEPVVDAAEPEINEDDLTIAKLLVKLPEVVKPTKGIVFKEPEVMKQIDLPVDSKSKGKEKVIEEAESDSDSEIDEAKRKIREYEASEALARKLSLEEQERVNKEVEERKRKADKKKPVKKPQKKSISKAETEKRRTMVRYLSTALGKPFQFFSRWTLEEIENKYNVTREAMHLEALEEQQVETEEVALVQRKRKRDQIKDQVTTEGNPEKNEETVDDSVQQRVQVIEKKEEPVKKDEVAEKTVEKKVEVPKQIEAQPSKVVRKKSVAKKPKISKEVEEPSNISMWIYFDNNQIDYFKIFRSDGTNEVFASEIGIFRKLSKSDLKKMYEIACTKEIEDFEEARLLVEDLKIMFAFSQTKAELKKKGKRDQNDSIGEGKVISWNTYENRVFSVTFEKGRMSFFLLDKRYDFEPIMMGSMLEVKKKSENLSEFDKELIGRLREQLLELNAHYFDEEVVELKQKKVIGWGVDQDLRYVIKFDDGSDLCDAEWENILDECTRENLKEMYEQRCTVIKVAVNDKDNPDQAKKRKFVLECLFCLSINDEEMEYYFEECETDALDIQRLQGMMKVNLSTRGEPTRAARLLVNKMKTYLKIRLTNLAPHAEKLSLGGDC
ncbi:hypothetical protein OSB04_001331 [Centaurea solstitialis]|uniref:Uncharacterized protein n=1 Tax=Centaurea solstitialis TaxID=347529 RepID=A0AA38TQT3_9ASTR|nr:hypothetical protein OSB04_001331 [Centaurea solstitialis]